ncbi:MAG TPA: TraR/DksA C4-type zinc finger protein [Phnomibacter sp.]|nr:TraR/DksA C4-type zinc finger protein [Phnomibacter sp.]
MATAKKTATAKTKTAAKKAAPAAAKKVAKAAPPAKGSKASSKPKEAKAAPVKAAKAPAKTATTPAKAKAAATKPDPVAKAVAKAPVATKTAPETRAAKPAKVAEPATAPAPVKKTAEKKEPAKPVNMPKITAQGKVQYEPDFTHSVLDTPKENAPVTTPTQRYSDSDLAEFRELISRKLESARKELSYLQGLITRKDDTGGDGEDGRYMTMEDGTLSMEREQLSQMASRQIQFIDHLEKAMIRIENKTYGICRETGKLIDKARLRAVPHATLSVEAKMRKSR